jgi:hypothetical protein
MDRQRQALSRTDTAGRTDAESESHAESQLVAPHKKQQTGEAEAFFLPSLPVYLYKNSIFVQLISNT